LTIGAGESDRRDWVKKVPIGNLELERLGSRRPKNRIWRESKRKKKYREGGGSDRGNFETLQKLFRRLGREEGRGGMIAKHDTEGREFPLLLGINPRGRD